MVKVANDRRLADGELTSDLRRPVVPRITLREVLALPSAVGTRVVGADDLDRSVTRATILDGVGLPVSGVRHHVLVVPGRDLAVGGHGATEPLAVMAGAGAAAVAVTGAGPGDAEAWSGAAARVGLPLLLLAGDASGERLATEVLGVMLDHQRGILEREDEVHRTLVQIVLAGGSLGDLCVQLVGFYDGAAMVTTSDGRVLAAAGSEAELGWARALDCFDRTGRLITEAEPVGIRLARDVRGNRAMVRIVAGSMDHGRLVAFCSHRRLTADDVHLLERAATVAALAITKEQAVSAVESKYRAEFLRDALAGRAGSPEEAIGHAQSLGWNIDRRMVVVVAETDEDDDHTTRPPDEVRSLQQRFSRAWTQAVGVRDPRTPVMGFSQEVVALFGVPEHAEVEAIMRSVSEVVRVVRGDGGGGRRTFSTGVSRPISSAADLPVAYEEALSAVSVGRQMHGDSALTHFDGLGIYRLLALIPDSADLRRFVAESLGELATDDSPDYADLRQTLGILLDTNLNVAETARRLFFHYNTLRYRIGKLEKMLGPFTTDPQLRLTLALALKVHQMRGI
jgi:purine catabolism regulator